MNENPISDEDSIDRRQGRRPGQDFLTQRGFNLDGWKIKETMPLNFLTIQSKTLSLILHPL